MVLEFSKTGEKRSQSFDAIQESDQFASLRTGERNPLSNVEFRSTDHGSHIWHVSSDRLPIRGQIDSLTHGTVKHLEILHRCHVL